MGEVFVIGRIGSPGEILTVIPGFAIGELQLPQLLLVCVLPFPRLGTQPILDDIGHTLHGRHTKYSCRFSNNKV